MNTMLSEVQRMRQQIELECEALRNMSLPSSVATHEFIHNKHRSLEKRVDELAAIIGEKDANTFTFETYCRIVG